MNTMSLRSRRVSSSLACLLAAAALGTLSVGAIAQDKTPAAASAKDEGIAFARQLSNAFKSVARAVEPSVVHITALTKVQPVRYDFFGRPIARGTPSLQPSSLGSGVIISVDGYVVTNNHVVKGADMLRAKLADGTEFDAKLVGRDELTDLAVIKIEPKDQSPKFAAAQWADSEALEVGEWVVAIGSPFGLSNTVTQGIVSAKGRSVTPRETGRTQEDFIQTDAAINPGNSGGPLLNLESRIVGINSAIASRSGGYEGIGFAIPANTARTVVENIIANGRVVRGWLGVALEDARSYQLEGHPQGVAVTQVVRESPAEQAGLQVGDVILKFKGAAVNEPRLRQAIAISSPGTKADVEVLRGKEIKTVSVSLADQAAANGEVRIDPLGMSVRTLTAQQARRLGYRDVAGVVVTSIDADGRGARATPSPFQEGDIIVGIREDGVKDADSFARLAESLDYNRGVPFMVIRDTERGQLLIRD